MPNLNLLTNCELHVHIGGCLTAQDLLDMGRDIYQDVDWSHFTTWHKKAYGFEVDPIALFKTTLAGGQKAFTHFKKQFVYSQADGGDFIRFAAKYGLIRCLVGHCLQFETNIYQQIFQRLINRHRQEGIDYIEYRSMYKANDWAGFKAYHLRHVQAIKTASNNGFQARYIISIPRETPMESYQLVQRLFTEYPQVVPFIVGLDFCAIEEGFPPKSALKVFQQVVKDNHKNPHQALEIVYHVGESYFDKSLESAIRWCHEAAQMGAKRLGHAIALALDPAIAIQRRPNAHQQELVSERLDQITYDLTHASALAEYGVTINQAALLAEQATLLTQDPTTFISQPYNKNRLTQIKKRQQFVLDYLTTLGTVIECCPTSNLRIGGVPHQNHHPLHRFLASSVNLVIGADDPGILDTPLAAEIDWILTHTHLDEQALIRRLGNPRRFRLAQNRNTI